MRLEFSSFVSNSPAPLQTEIQKHMQISDSQFNAFYSLKTLSSIIPPIIMTVVSSKVLTIKSVVLSLCIACTLGQALFAVGIQNNDYTLCLVGRFLIGTSDALTIMQ